jgi:AraC-like DNA-binding protein
MFIRVSSHAVGIAFERVLILVAVQPEVAPPVEVRPRRCMPLQKWRLKRVVEYVDSHLSSRITLAGMAAAAGLSRMHFAAQFRAATATRPHHYVLQRRIERAQELLRNRESTLVDVALSVGFQSQSHFSTIFKRLVGETPHRWRQAAAHDRAIESGVDEASTYGARHTLPLTTISPTRTERPVSTAG